MRTTVSYSQWAGVVCVALFGLFSLRPLQAAWEHPETFRERRMVVFMSFDGDSDYTERDRQVLYDALVIELASANPDVVILQEGSHSTPVRFEQKVEYARAREADAWFEVVVYGSMERLVARGTSYDLLRTQEIGAFEIERPFSTGFRDIERGIWGDAAAVLQEHYAKYQDAVEVRFRGAPGTTLRNIWDEPFELNENGELTLLLPSPMTYRYRATLRGRYPETGTFYLQHDPLFIEIPSERAARFAVEFFTANFRYLGAAASLYLIPSSVYVRTAAVSYAFGLFLLEDYGEYRVPNLIDGAPLTELTSQLGAYLRPPDTLLRPYLSAGGVLRLTHDDASLAAENSAPFGMIATLGLEYSPNLRTRFFVEYAPRVFEIESRDAFLSTTLPNSYVAEQGSPAGYVFSRPYLVRVFEFHLGLRRQF